MKLILLIITLGLSVINGLHWANLPQLSQTSTETIPITSPTYDAQISPSLLHIQEGETKDIVIVFEKKIPKYLEIPGLHINERFGSINAVYAQVSHDALLELAQRTDVGFIFEDRLIQLGLKQHESNYSNDRISNSGKRSIDPQLYRDWMHVGDVWAQGWNGSGALVVVIDTGVDGSHPDLNGAIVAFYDGIEEVEGTIPMNGSTCGAYDVMGHGTACAGIIAGQGIHDPNYKGIAPGARILAIRAAHYSLSSDDWVFSWTPILRGLQYSIDFVNNNMTTYDLESLVISCSFGGLGLTSTEEGAYSNMIQLFNATICGSAGNEGNWETVGVPGGIQSAICVGAANTPTQIAGFSSKGPNINYREERPDPDIVAPGVDIVSPKLHDISFIDAPQSLLESSMGFYPSTGPEGLYLVWQGTSASCPMVAGVAALLLDAMPQAYPIEIKLAMMTTATDMGLLGNIQGAGFVNASAAIESLLDGDTSATYVGPKRLPAGPSEFYWPGRTDSTAWIEVISTENFGQLFFSIEGNASYAEDGFFYLLENSASVTTPIGAPITYPDAYGYHWYAKYRITAQRELSIDKLGRYTGTLTVRNVNQEMVGACSINIDLRKFLGTILIDSAHHDIDMDDPFSFGVFLDSLGGLRWIEDKYYEITPGLLALSESLLIMDTEGPYTDAEVQTIQEFVYEGGILLIFGELYNESNNEASFDFDGYNRILEPMGVQFIPHTYGVPETAFGDENTGITYNVTAAENPLSEGIESIYVLWGSAINVTDSQKATELLNFKDSDFVTPERNESDDAFLVQGSYGKGIVIVGADGSTFYDSILFEALEAGGQNREVIERLGYAMNPQRPSFEYIELYENGVLAFDTSINVVHPTEFASGANISLVAYVYDVQDALPPNVTVQFLDGSGTVVRESQTKNTIGFKFVAEFVAELTGSYTVQLRAEDSEDHIKTYEFLNILFKGTEETSETSQTKKTSTKGDSPGFLLIISLFTIGTLTVFRKKR